MERRTVRTMISGVLFIAALVFFEYGMSYAVTSYKTAFEKAYPFARGTVIDSCTLCHTATSGSAPRNPYGAAYGSNRHSFTSIANQDSDGDGFKNIVEIKDLTFPGDAPSKPRPPMVSVFTVKPSATHPYTATITALTTTSPSLATIAGYIVTEAPTKPKANAAGWTSTKPATYTFAAAGTKTLYAWAKDMGGLISAGKSAAVAFASPADAAPAEDAASQPQETISAETTSLIPLPAGQDTYIYDSAAQPAHSVDPASAMPVEVSTSGEGEGTIDMQANIGKFEEPVNEDITLYSPSEESYFEPEDILQQDNTLQPVDMGQPATIGADPLMASVYEVQGAVSGNMSQPQAASKRVSVAVAAPADAASAGGAALRPQTTVSVARSLIPLPVGQETFIYDADASPVRSVDPASAMPVGVSSSDEGEGTIDMQVSIGKFEGPVNVYLTLYAPVEESYYEPEDIYSLQPDNTLKPVDMGQLETSGMDPWKTNVDEVDEAVFSNMSQAGLPVGQYLVVLTVTNANNEYAHYAWMTHFLVQ